MARYRVNVDALNARAAPVDGKIKYVARRGHEFTVIVKRRVRGQWWGKTQSDNWYCLLYCRMVVRSPVPGRGVTTPYGRRKAGLWRTKGYHTGNDYAADRGEPVVAVRHGVVRRGWDSVLGNVAMLQADNGRTYWYCHLSKVTKTGRVRAGAKIGEVGDSGSGARGPHLHFEDHAGHTGSWWARDRSPRW